MFLTLLTHILQGAGLQGPVDTPDSGATSIPDFGARKFVAQHSAGTAADMVVAVAVEEAAVTAAVRGLLVAGGQTKVPSQLDCWDYSMEGR